MMLIFSSPTDLYSSLWSRENRLGHILSLKTTEISAVLDNNFNSLIVSFSTVTSWWRDKAKLLCLYVMLEPAICGPLLQDDVSAWQGQLVVSVSCLWCSGQRATGGVHRSRVDTVLTMFIYCSQFCFCFLFYFFSLPKWVAMGIHLRAVNRHMIVVHLAACFC